MSFYDDVIRKDARFASSARVDDLALLEPVTRAAVTAIIQDAKTLGVEVMVFETFRSQARQRELFHQGATTRLRTVGVHNYGLACDIVKAVAGEPCWKGDFGFLGRLARQHKLIWGGDWGRPGHPHHFVDAVHVQRCSVSKEAALFLKEWYPGDDYDPYTHD